MVFGGDVSEYCGYFRPGPTEFVLVVFSKKVFSLSSSSLMVGMS